MDEHTTSAEGGAGERAEPVAINAPDNNMLMGILAYLGPLVIISFLVAKDNSFVKYHIKQGLVLLSISVLLWAMRFVPFMWAFWWVFQIVYFALFILAIVGIVNVVGGKEKPLPLVGQFSKYFRI